MRQGIVIGILTSVVFASALCLVIVKDANRAMFIELNHLHIENEALHTEWDRLQIEYGAFRMEGRIEMIARAQLDMRYPEEIIAVELQ